MMKHYFLFFLLIISYTSCTSSLEGEQMIEEEMMDEKEEEILISEYSVDHYKSLTGLYTYDKDAVGIPCRDRAKELARGYFLVRQFYKFPKRGYTATINFHNHLCMPQDEFESLVNVHMETLNTFYNIRQMEDSRDCEPVCAEDIPDIDFSYEINPTLGLPNWQDWDNFKHRDLDNVEMFYDDTQIHIWVIDVLDDGYGYASSPDCNPNYDGIVIDKTYFLNHVDTHQGGMVLTMLMSEYLGIEPLRYYFLCNDGDINDVPIHEDIFNIEDFERLKDSSAIAECRSGVKNMFENFMSYAPDTMRNIFTSGQIIKMNFYIENSPSLSKKITL